MEHVASMMQPKRLEVWPRLSVRSQVPPSKSADAANSQNSDTARDIAATVSESHIQSSVETLEDVITT